MTRNSLLPSTFQRCMLSGCMMLICLLLHSRVNAQTVDQVTLQLKWHHQFQFAGYYAAQQQGFYKDAKLNVKLVEGGPSDSPVGNVLSGKADFGVTGSDILNFYINKDPVVVISAIYQHNPYVFITLADKKINTPTDLAGKTLMASPDQGWLVLQALFLKEGIPIDSIHIIPHTWNNRDLIEGKVDAMSAYNTVEPEQFKKLGVEINMLSPIDYGIDFYGDVLFTTHELADQNPELVERFNQASLKGWEYAMTHQSELADYILTLPGVKDRGITKTDLMTEAGGMEKLILPKLVEIGHINRGRWQNMLAIYQQLGIVSGEVNLDNFLFEPPAVKKIKYFNTLLYSLGVGLILFVIALIWNRQLRRQVHKKTLALRKEIQVRKNTEQSLELAIAAAGLAIWEWDVHQNEIKYDNKWIRSLGYDPADLNTPASWMNIVHPDDQEGVREIKRNLKEGRIADSHHTYRIKTSNGYWKWILAISKIMNFNEETRPAYIMGIYLDIDFIKRKEAELHEITLELKRANNELQQFAYIASHNLRAPVVNLIGLVELQADEQTPAELNREINEKIHFCIKQLDSTLNDLIEIVASKRDTQVQKETLDFQIELGHVIKTIEKQIQESEVRIETNFSEVRSIYYPKQLLQSIFINLLTNSIKYRSSQRKLVINVKTRIKNEYVILSFSDNGQGMDMKRFRNKIFGLYQRFHTNIDGKGLGLYIIKTQIESMDGKIDVESVPELGTTFKIYFKNAARH